MAVAAVAAAGAAAVADAGVERTEEGVVMASIRNGCAAIVVGLLACLAQEVRAQQELPPLVSKLNPAWERLGANNAKFLNLDQQALLDDLAFAAAVGAGCPGFQVDPEKFEQGFKAFKTDDYMKLPPDQKRKLEYRLMASFGATVALYWAEGLLHPKEGCKFAEQKRSLGPGRFWVQPAAAAPAR